MNLVVHKFVWPLGMPSGVVEIEMRRGAQILHVDNQNENVCIWARVDLDVEMEKRKMVLVATGSPCPADIYVGTVMLRGGALVLHIFEQHMGRAAAAIL